ncbi:MAG: aromatic amino acid DMT transporter YddG [Mitsuaria chitosanitabida]|uniref:aromatic amino acid DMT transporter YddG n=1 Tax=Roseateles chitosanitabidus TaxID=65048 RepID=UPI001B0C08E4|nr:aromatic amino acid DMT transporter YddG [Roseateles chitosanitabidus]MBO9685277.1 aromatic amino acid DMT transporter YddG [Roseateles chitosanitabidus]
MSGSKQATLIGLTAVGLWSSVVGLIRGVSESFGATGGAALIYTVASAMLVLTVGPTRLREMPRRYLWVGGGLFVAYELCLSLSLGYANNARQAIEVGMVNYLWPTFTLTAAILFNRQRTNALIVPGFILGILGVCWVLGGDQGLNLAEMLANVRSNPLSYGLAFLGAVIWAAYCTVTARIAEGKSGVTLFFALTALTLWIKYALTDNPPMTVDLRALVLLVLAASAMGFGYAAWNVGILRGNMTVLAGASYFVPVFSAALAAAVLRTPLSLSFWQGACMVVAGSVLCWLATRARQRRTA